MTTFYFQYCPTNDAVSLFSDRAQRHGGMMPSGVDVEGIALADFRKAVAGKIVKAEDGQYVIRPATAKCELAF